MFHTCHRLLRALHSSLPKSRLFWLVCGLMKTLLSHFTVKTAFDSTHSACYATDGAFLSIRISSTASGKKKRKKKNSAINSQCIHFQCSILITISPDKIIHEILLWKNSFAKITARAQLESSRMDNYFQLHFNSNVLIFLCIFLIESRTKDSFILL